MKAKLLLLILLLFSFDNILLSQTSDEFIKGIQNDFKNYTPETSVNLVPFRDKETGKYGYIDAVSKEIVVTAKYDKLRFFKKNMEGEYKGSSFLLSPVGKKLVATAEVDGAIDIAELRDYDSVVSENKSSKDLDKGFQVIDRNGRKEIGAHSHIYKFVDTPFLYESKYYAIACKVVNDDPDNDFMSRIIYGIINTEGNYLPGFDFGYRYIKLNEYAKGDDDLYFVVLNDYGQEYFLSTSGKQIIVKKGKEEKMSSYSEIRTILNLYLYPKFGYVIYQNGLFDLVKMTWIINPEKGISLQYIDYSSTKKIPDLSPEYRDDVKIYIEAEKRKELPYAFYMDIAGYCYLP